MRIACAIPILAFLGISASGQERNVDIPGVEVSARRPLKEIGIQTTVIDTVALHENIALSMADVLSFNSSIFVKNSGRATLSTVSFRGTSASHTQVTWNGMKINSPMLGMTDFSTIPAYFIDGATLVHGSGSVNETGGGLGGTVKLTTHSTDRMGWGAQYIQGIGSFTTFDEYARVTYGNGRFRSSTRIAYSSSANDYHYRNHDKKENIYDDEYNIIGQYYPTEVNRNGDFRSLNILQELGYAFDNGNRMDFSAWYMDSNRGLPLLSTDYSSDRDFENRQRERTLRAVASWDHIRQSWKVGTKVGYTYSWQAYDYRTDKGTGMLEPMVCSRSSINSLYIQGNGEYYIGRKWLFTADISLYQHFVESYDRSVIGEEGRIENTGYDKSRTEADMMASAKWRPTDRFAVSFTLREMSYGTDWSPIVPALFIDGVLWKRANLTAKASISRNYRFPTLNDMYFQPGGNPDLVPEKGFTYDLGHGFSVVREKYSISGSATWFDSRIDDWIIWLPTVKGYYSPRNLRSVHAYGVELQCGVKARLSDSWSLGVDGSYSYTPSVNVGEKMSEGDQSIGKQLPYVPLHSASITGNLRFRSWSLLYKWCYYSERYTMTSNAYSYTGVLPDYFMNNVALEKQFHPKWADVSLKCSVNNLLDEEYISVLSHPMPGINFEFFIGITPKW